ncbi:hypothetical protein J7M22_14525 [Candidatus Poribacteria bacterium]|nr:hypothetical protein [Candidatus Poribacteria bacterium]
MAFALRSLAFNFPRSLPLPALVSALDLLAEIKLRLNPSFIHYPISVLNLLITNQRGKSQLCKRINIIGDHLFGNMNPFLQIRHLIASTIPENNLNLPSTAG